MELPELETWMIISLVDRVNDDNGRVSDKYYSNVLESVSDLKRKKKKIRWRKLFEGGKWAYLLVLGWWVDKVVDGDKRKKIANGIIFFITVGKRPIINIIIPISSSLRSHLNGSRLTVVRHSLSSNKWAISELSLFVIASPTAKRRSEQ